MISRLYRRTISTTRDQLIAHQRWSFDVGRDPAFPFPFSGVRRLLLSGAAQQGRCIRSPAQTHTFIGFSRFRMPPLTQILEQSRWNVHSQPLAKERLLEPPRTWLGTRAPTTQALCRPRPRSAARPLPWGRTRRRRIGQGSLTRRTRLGAASRRAEVQREPMCGPAPAARPSSQDRWLRLGPSRTHLTATSRSGLA